MGGEISGPCTPDNMIAMFQEKMAGEGNDSDEVILQAFKAYESEGKIDSKMFTHALMTWGDKMSKAGLFVAVKEEEKKEEAPPPVEEAAPAAEEDEGEAKKKKKKKKKAAK